MCFSAEASFIGAAALAIIGTATLKVTSNPRNQLWAAIPLLFAFQQFCEGIVWLDLRGTIPHSALTVLAKDLYLLFALAGWLIWFPVAFITAEQNPTRKLAMKAFLFLGVLIAYTNLNAYPILQLSPTLNKHSISYLNEADLYKRLAYLSVIAFPPILSSLKYMKIFGLLAIISCVVAEYFYVTTFTSVWCFLGGIASAALFLIARANASCKDTIKTSKKVLAADKKLVHK